MWRSSLLVLLVLASRAHADKAAADVAFQAAKALMAQGKIAEACPKFELSHKEDPQLGSLLNLADCHEKIGKLATAWAEFREAIDLAKAKNDDREGFARERSEKLAPRVSHIKLVGTKDIKVSLDGRDVSALVGESIPMDPGEHEIVTKQGSAPEAKRTVKLAHDGEELEIQVPIPADQTLPEGAPPAKSKRKLIGVITAGAGLAVAGVGLYFGKRAFDQYDESQDHCDDNNACDPKGAQLIDDARSSALTSNILIGVGVAAIATGAILWFTAPKERPTAVTARPVVGPSTVAGVIELRF